MNASHHKQHQSVSPTLPHSLKYKRQLLVNEITPRESWDWLHQVDSTTIAESEVWSSVINHGLTTESTVESILSCWSRFYR